MRFPGFYGNESLKTRLSRTEANGEFSHCYILEGPAGSGKKTLARCMAAAMECTGTGPRPCGVCPSCHKIFGGGHPDVITVDSDKATVPISVIRDMQSDAYIRPNEGIKKIYLIPRGQDMQTPAQNALLKLLEEPPEYCAFLIMTENAEKILTTVRSRSVTLELFPLSDQELHTRLTELYPNADADSLASAMQKSGGYLGSAISFLKEGATKTDALCDTIVTAFAGGDELELLTAMSPLEKLKRPDFLELLQQLHLVFTRALGKKSGGKQAATKSSALLASKCSRQQLFRADTAIIHAIGLLMANGSAGHCVGYLLSAMRS